MDHVDEGGVGDYPDVVFVRGVGISESEGGDEAVARHLLEKVLEPVLVDPIAAEVEVHYMGVLAEGLTQVLHPLVLQVVVAQDEPGDLLIDCQDAGKLACEHLTQTETTQLNVSVVTADKAVLESHGVRVVFMSLSKQSLTRGDHLHLHPRHLLLFLSEVFVSRLK